MLHGRATTVLSDDFPHEKWEFPRPSLKFFSWKSMFNNNRPQKNLLGLVVYSWGCAKETAPVINIEINGVRGIWLTFLEWDLLEKKLNSHFTEGQVHLASPAMQEIGKRNNIYYLEKWEIFFSFAYLSAVWLQFWQNPVQKSCLQWFQLDFAQIATKQLIDKQN